MDYAKCTINTTDSVIVVKENKSKFEVINLNNSPIQKIQVDGCLIGSEHEKCDWLVSTTKEPLRAIYVELKGCDIKKATSQLKNTLKLTEAKYRAHKRECYAVTSRIPKHGTDVRRMMIDFFKETKATLSVKNISISIEV